MDAFLEGSLNIRTSVSADIFDAKTDVAHQHKEASGDDGNNDGSSEVTLTPICISKSRVATTTPKISILFNQLEDIKVGYFGSFEFLDIQRSHCETFVDNPTIFPANPTNQNKTMSEKNYIHSLNSARWTF